MKETDAGETKEFWEKEVYLRYTRVIKLQIHIMLINDHIILYEFM